MASFPEAGLDLSALPGANRGADLDMIRCRRAGLADVRLLALTRLAGCQPADSARFAPVNPSDGALADLRRV
jgi:hypothetical protein